MTVSSVSLNISTPSEPIMSGRGFYQLEEEALFVQVGLFTKHRRFYSYLEAAGLTLDFDRHGRLIFVEVDVPRKHWVIQPYLAAPRVVEPADIRWLNFRDTILDPVFQTNGRRDLLRLTFGRSDQLLSYYVADSVIVQTDFSYTLMALWIIDICDDMGGAKIRSYRKHSRAKGSYYS